MPPAPKRRRTTSGGPATVSSNAASTKAGQSTLSFRSSKSGARSIDNKKSVTDRIIATSHATPVRTDVPEAQEIASTPPKKQVDVLQVPAIEVDQTAVEPSHEVEQEDKEEDVAEIQLNSKALALSEAKIKSYWAAKEAERKAPRVHQKGLTVREKILREFDMSSRYGPSIGITRLGRWRRAHNIGMNPPVEVLAVLLKEGQLGGKQHATSGAHQTSIMDDLIMSSRIRDGSLTEA